MNRHAHTTIKWVFCLIFLFISVIAFGQTKRQKEMADAIRAQVLKNMGDEDLKSLLKGRIIINIYQISHSKPKSDPPNPNDKYKESCTQQQTSIKTEIYGRAYPDRVKTYMKYPAERWKLGEGWHIPVFLGGSSYDEIGGTTKEYTLNVAYKSISQGWVDLNKTSGKPPQWKYVVTGKQSAEGGNDLEAINIEIKSYVEAGNPKVVPLTPKPEYVLWITGEKKLKYMNEQPVAPGENFRWNDETKQLEAVDEPVSLGIPYTINDPDMPYEDEEGTYTYEQLLIKDVKEFDAFLLNPRVYVFEGTAKRYTNEYPIETTTYVSVNLVLINDGPLPPPSNPPPPLAPLEPDDDRLAPLVPEK